MPDFVTADCEFAAELNLKWVAAKLVDEDPHSVTFERYFPKKARFTYISKPVIVKRHAEAKCLIRRRFSRESKARFDRSKRVIARERLE